MASAVKRIRHPHHLKKQYVSWRFKILKHHHTGERVNHQHTSYPLLALLLLGIGAVLLNSTLSAYAGTSDSFNVQVSAKVMGVPPTDPATIDAPADGTTFTAAPITVTGTCPDKTYVQLFRNNYASGTALCTNDHTYSIQTDLFSGANALVVRDYNYADQAGPDSDPVTVTYSPPVVVPPITGSGDNGGSTNSGSTGSTGSTGGSHSSGSGSSTGQPLTLHNDFHFLGYTVGSAGSWQVSIAGGSAPYSISVAWGDGQTALYTSKTADTLTLTHTYTASGPTDGAYRIIISASDAAGNHTTLQVLALVTGSSSASGSSSGGTTGKSGGFSLFSGNLLQTIGYLWSLYGALCIVLLSFWLGEQRELRVIRTRFRLTKL